MEQEFKTFLDNITLTSAQSEDAKTKYTNVCKKLHSFYYEGEDYNENKKYLFGSYKTKTNVRPLTDDQDVDVLFKIPQETFDKFDAYESNGQAALLQEVRNILKEKYTTTDKIKAWGKVVLVELTTHNVEVLPALEQEDKTFLIPNSEDGGSWETFDPRAEVENFKDSNSDTDGLTRDITKMAKTWIRNTTTLDYKSYKVMNDVIDFLEDNYPDGKGTTNYSKVICDFFDYLKTNGSTDIQSHVNTAYSRSVKALEYVDNDKLVEASEQWRLIFGSEFPKVKENPKREQSASVITNPAKPWLNYQ